MKNLKVLVFIYQLFIIIVALANSGSFNFHNLDFFLMEMSYISENTNGSFLRV